MKQGSFQKVLSGFCVIFLLAGIFSFAVPVAAATLDTRGDVNEDNITDIADLIHLKKIFAGTVERKATADVNGDGYLTAEDLATLRHILLKMGGECEDWFELLRDNISCPATNIRLSKEEAVVNEGRTASLTLTNTAENGGWPAIFIPFNETVDLRKYTSFSIDACFEGTHSWISVGFFDKDWKRLPGGDADYRQIGFDFKQGTWGSMNVDISEFGFSEEIMSNVGGMIITVNTNDNVKLNDKGESYIYFDNLCFNEKTDNDLICTSRINK